MKWKKLLDEWKEKNEDVIVRIEGLADSVVSAERVKKNLAVWYKTEGGVAYRLVHAWVFNPNTGSEEAYWEGSEPTLIPTATTTFRDTIVKTLNGLKEKGVIVAYRLESVDETAKTAIVYAYTKVSDGVKEDRRVIAEVEGKITADKIV